MINSVFISSYKVINSKYFLELIKKKVSNTNERISGKEKTTSPQLVDIFHRMNLSVFTLIDSNLNIFLLCAWMKLKILHCLWCSEFNYSQQCTRTFGLLFIVCTLFASVFKLILKRNVHVVLSVKNSQKNLVYSTSVCT